MPKILWKDLFVEIRHSLGRFFSIVCIVALGVAFFAGIKASAPDMKYSADQYFDKYDTQDIQVFSTLGLRKSDIEAIKKIDGVEQVQPLYSFDALARIGASEQVFKVFSLPKKSELNKVRLVEGRMPTKEDECLIEAPNVMNELFDGYKIGDTIHLYSGDSTPISDTLKYDSYKIVGTCYSTRYLSYEKGVSSIGSGSVNSFVFIPEEDFKPDYYTEIDVSVKGAKKINTYSQQYFDQVVPVVKKIEAIAGKQIDAQIAKEQKNLDDAKKEANQKIADGQKQLDEAKTQYEGGMQKLAQSENELASAKAKLDSGWNEYNQNIAQLNTGLPQLNAGIAQIEEQEAKLPGLQNQLNDLKAQQESLISQKKDLEAKILQIDQALATKQSLLDQQAALLQQQAALKALYEQQGISEEDYNEQNASLQTSLDQIEGALSQFPDSLASQKQQAQEGLSALEAGSSQCEAGIAQLQDGIAKIQQAVNTKQSLLAQKEAILAAYPQLEQAYSTLVASQNQYESGLAQLQSGKEELASAKQEIEENQAKLDQEKKSAEQKIADGQKKIDDLKGEWVVLDRDSFYSYRDYEACADRMDGIASVFPVFFFLVAALVCMTTMTRMVDEQRTEIGTLKALGYSKGQIAMKYLMYALLASLLGSIIGCAIGMFVFPYIIFYAWNTMYLIETIQFEFQPWLMIGSSLAVTLVVLLATFLSIYKELMEVPSQLMRPKAAKAGKKILLEKVSFIWDRLSFLHKVTIRNIFRYKKRFFMTVIGIAGCSALLVAGFGINDSISDIVNQQYGNIYHIDASATAENDKKDVSELLKKDPNIKASFEEKTLNVNVDVAGKEMSATIHSIPLAEQNSFSSFTTLKSIDSKEELSIPKEGVLISQKLAEKKDLEVNDPIEFETLDGQSIKTKVAGIFENYVGHQIYVSQATFDSWKLKEKADITYLLQLKDTSDHAQELLGNRLLESGDFKSVQFYSSLEKNFLDMIGSIQMVVIVLVLSAAALAFVVLYNLSNVNISERMREIATIKVLGFTEKEVNAYVNRESLILAIIGSLCGLEIGIFLHHLIMNLAEMDDVMFGRTILWQSFLFSFLLTILFAWLVNFVMKFKLRKVKMVESLKAIE